MQDEWRIQMLPINFLFLTVWPVVDMRLKCRSNGHDYPPDVPLDITKVVELNMVNKHYICSLNVFSFHLLVLSYIFTFIYVSCMLVIYSNLSIRDVFSKPCNGFFIFTLYMVFFFSDEMGASRA